MSSVPHVPAAEIAAPFTAGPLEHARQVSVGRVTDESMQWIIEAMASYFRNDGEVTLDRIFGLPGTPAALRMARRDNWIRLAAEQVGSVRDLHREYCKFVNRGRWARWRDSAAPPETASRIDAALFFIARFSDGRDISLQHLRRIVRR